MVGAREVLVAGGVLLGALVAHRAGGGHHDRPRPRRHDRTVLAKHSSRRHRHEGSSRTRSGDGGGSHDAGGTAGGAAAGPSWHAMHWHGAAPRGWPYLLLLLQAVLSAAAVVFAEELRPPAIMRQDWQNLVALLASSAMVLSLAGAWRHYQAAAAAGGGGGGGGRVATAASRPGGSGQAAAPPQDLSGDWVKDGAASDSMDEACDVLRLGGLLRMAVGLVKGIQVRDDPAAGQFVFALTSAIPWFKVTERYPLDGTPASFKRRDLRRGKHVGHVQRCPDTGGMLLRVEWGAPLSGAGTDLFHLAGPDTLHLETSMVVEGRAVAYRQVYRRKGS